MLYFYNVIFCNNGAITVVVYNFCKVCHTELTLE